MAEHPLHGNPRAELRGRRDEAGQELGRRGCITVLRPSRRALLGAPQDDGKALMALRKPHHPEEAAERPSRRTHGADPANPWISCPASMLTPLPAASPSSVSPAAMRR